MDEILQTHEKQISQRKSPNPFFVLYWTKRIINHRDSEIVSFGRQIQYDWNVSGKRFIEEITERLKQRTK